MKAFEWVSPNTINDAVKLLQSTSTSRDPDDAPRPIAGGQDLLTTMKDYITRPDRVVNLKNIRGLPWKAIHNDEFEAVTHDDVLNVILRGWHHNYDGIAYNPKTNAFPHRIFGFKPLRDHWYVWTQPEVEVSLPRRYERTP